MVLIIGIVIGFVGCFIFIGVVQWLSGLKFRRNNKIINLQRHSGPGGCKYIEYEFFQTNFDAENNSQKSRDIIVENTIQKVLNETVFSSLFVRMLQIPNLVKRRFVVYVPPSLTFFPELTTGFLAKRHENKIPVVLLFHGTGSTAYTSSFYQYHYKYDVDDTGEDDNNNKNTNNNKNKSNNNKKKTEAEVQMAWKELADKEHVILVFCQSQHWPVIYNKEVVEALWQPGKNDINYVNYIINYLCDNYPCVNRNAIFGVGHSNGGLFISDLALKLSQKFTALCNHMGGYDKQQGQKEGQKQGQKEARKECPLLIITSPGEDNYVPCCRAKDYFEKHEFVKMEFMNIMPSVHHSFTVDRIPIIWEFFTKHCDLYKQQ